MEIVLASLVALIICIGGCTKKGTEPTPVSDTSEKSVAVPMMKGDVVLASEPVAFDFDSELEKHLLELKKKIPNDDFTVIVEKPFVVIGNETAFQVKYRTENTIRWAVELLKQDFFPNDPNSIIDIWLFRDGVDYRKYANEIFNDTPDSPYGYFSPSDNALIMNISTGGGTLVHEIVHPFVATNFPDSPAWFNEGLGSLYEACREIDGKIVGTINWRLPGTQEAIQEKRLPTFEDLFAMTEHEFYEKDKGNNYGQARYLCYYLQQRKLLREFYKQWRKNEGTDPTGYKTLQAVLKLDDMKQFQADWEAWVMKLK